MEISSIVIVAICVLLAFYVVSIFNKLVALKNQFKNGFAQIEVQLKRRYDLIPNLVETAKAYMSHEKETLENVIAARNQASQGLSNAASAPGDAAAMQQLIGAEAMLGSAMGKLNVVMEAYPDLKANQNMMQVSEELTSTENKVSFARQAYNDQVLAYNTYKQSFPQTLFASMFGHTQDASLLEFADSPQIQDAPKVSF
ncbi:LemA family protein [uncultured Paraglaciecola sp.]|uniref:LemA family protein n=1 Tax=uncultured Paraglaciecola sp. TaxID=1765024 RepID=UPI0030D9205F|tara:strand:+ start:58430 stop:59026 length:597 start_codon:yes stop_codon:yes gene_type:complete